ncbi:hypothetical protein YTPLAS72_30130 [Nitrospira sp.]|nr:hypothetical protein YTPLAS72_30130 [Nitrospira sp.]
MMIDQYPCGNEQKARLIRVIVRGSVVCLLVGGVLFAQTSTMAQSLSGASSGQSLAGGVSPQFKFGGGTLYIDNQGTQGFLYTPGQNFQSYNFRNPSTGQAWSGAVMTMGPQLSIGLIQGANQVGTSTVLPGPPRQPSPLPPIESTLLDELP